MMRCPICASRFCQTLERRWSARPPAPPDALLLKRRCKRCKTTWIEALDLPCEHRPAESPARGARLASDDAWRCALRVSRVASVQSTLLGARLAIMASDYSRRISRPCDATRDYLKRLDFAQGVRADHLAALPGPSRVPRPVSDAPLRTLEEP